MTATLLRRLKKLEETGADKLEATRPRVWGVDTFTIEQFRELLLVNGFQPDACGPSASAIRNGGDHIEVVGHCYTTLLHHVWPQVHSCADDLGVGQGCGEMGGGRARTRSQKQKARQGWAGRARKERSA
jgi:hypothetical protein